MTPQLKHIKRFGCAAYYYDTRAQGTSKFAQRSNLAILLECNETVYTLFDTNKAIITRSKDVDFVESKVYGDFYGPEAVLPINEELGFGEVSSAPSELQLQEFRNPTADDASDPVPNRVESLTDDPKQDTDQLEHQRASTLGNQARFLVEQTSTISMMKEITPANLKTKMVKQT